MLTLMTLATTASFTSVPASTRTLLGHTRSVQPVRMLDHFAKDGEGYPESDSTFFQAALPAESSSQTNAEKNFYGAADHVRLAALKLERSLLLSLQSQARELKEQQAAKQQPTQSSVPAPSVPELVAASLGTDEKLHALCDTLLGTRCTSDVLPVGTAVMLLQASAASHGFYTSVALPEEEERDAWLHRLYVDVYRRAFGQGDDSSF